MSTLPGLLFARAAQQPRATAMQEKRYGVWQPLTWAQYARRVRELAHGMAGLGVGRGDVVAVLLLDEPSLGLAPLLVDEVFEIIRQLNTDLGLTVLLVEQNARRALAAAHRGYVMESGRTVLAGTADDLADNPDVKEFYLGLGETGERRGYRDVKHYKRRKRWL